MEIIQFYGMPLYIILSQERLVINNKTAICSLLAIMAIIESFLASCVNHLDYPLLE